MLGRRCDRVRLRLLLVTFCCLLLSRVDALEVGLEDFQTSRDGVEVPRLGEEGELRVEPRYEGE